MKDRGSKIFGFLFFLFLCGGIAYLSLTSAHTNKKDNYESITISGNLLLNKEEYLKYCGLNDTSKFNEITLAEVKSKIEAHPYIINSEVSFDGINKIIVDIIENRPKAFIMSKNKFQLVSENGELLPVLNKELLVNLPLITNFKDENEDLQNNEELISAFKIMDVVRMTDENMYASLAEINLRKGGDVLIMFTGLGFPIVFGKNNEVKKILALKNIWNNLVNDNNLINNVEYIDLRYKNKIFIGKRITTQISG